MTIAKLDRRTIELADHTQRITSKFAHLDGITEPAALERELAKLSPAEQEEYLGA